MQMGLKPMFMVFAITTILIVQSKMNVGIWVFASFLPSFTPSHHFVKMQRKEIITQGIRI